MDVGSKIMGAVGIIIVVIALLNLTPTVVDQVQTIITGGSGWTFTGSDGALALLGLVPFVWVASILIAAAVGMFELARA